MALRIKLANMIKTDSKLTSSSPSPKSVSVKSKREMPMCNAYLQCLCAMPMCNAYVQCLLGYESTDKLIFHEVDHNFIIGF